MPWGRLWRPFGRLLVRGRDPDSNGHYYPEHPLTRKHPKGTPEANPGLPLSHIGAQISWMPIEGNCEQPVHILWTNSVGLAVFIFFSCCAFLFVRLRVYLLRREGVNAFA